MSTATTGIGWTDRTWNPIRGCSRVSAGCTHCYAERTAARFRGKGQPYESLVAMHGTEPRWTGTVRLIASALMEPLSWKKPARVFVNSMSDLFHEALEFEEIAAVYAVMHAAPHITFQVLTKRPERRLEWTRWIKARGGLSPYVRSMTHDRATDMASRHFRRPFTRVTRTKVVRGKTVRRADDPWMLVYSAASVWSDGPLCNVWEGVSVEDQATADERIPLLLETPAALRFVSAEPLLGPIDLRAVRGGTLDALDGHDFESIGDIGDGGDLSKTVHPPALDWIIVGGESGHNARPYDVQWVRAVVEQCGAAGVACFVKQLGGHAVLDLRYDRTIPGATRRLRDRKGSDPEEWPEDLRLREFPNGGPDANHF